jgi:hypothetical protein
VKVRVLSWAPLPLPMIAGNAEFRPSSRCGYAI